MQLKTLFKVLAVGLVLVGTHVPSTLSETMPPPPQPPINLDVCGAHSLPAAHVKARVVF